MQRYTDYFIWKLLYIFRVVPSPIIRSAYNCIYSSNKFNQLDATNVMFMGPCIVIIF